ncbi:hypothetical protein DPSP01_010304 [Paraphaeosphaeria sporulosa]
MITEAPHGTQRRDLRVFKDAIIREVQELRTENLDYAFGARLLALTDGALRDHVLGRLRFNHQYDREYKIAEAHAETFRWVFEPPRDPAKPFTNFQDWLKQDSQHVYWITGKAGSGKSTLMKYIVHDRHCDEFLRSWAGPLPLLTTRFYFWNSGSQIQMSQEGLLRSILHEALTKRPDMIPKVLPDLWTAFQTLRFKDSAWLLTDLMIAFDRLVACATENHFKICFFVDGLDEFDGDLEALAILFRKAAKSPNVKACLSSRPWEVFEEAFLTLPSLRLQHLTFFDIRSYVTSHLHGHSGFQGLARREPAFATSLIENIATKASGVFLWVFLTVKSLLIGFTNGDRISDLQGRLDEIPDDLQLFYLKIFDSIDPVYTKHAYQIFHLVEAAEGSLTAMGLYYADQDMDGTQLIKSAQAAKITPLSAQEYSDRYEAINKRLNSRWKGLFEIEAPLSDILGRSGNRKVSYLHRTARDFLRSPEIFTRMKPSIRDTDLQLTLAGSCIFLMKFWRPSTAVYGPDHQDLERYFLDAIDWAGNSATGGVLALTVFREAIGTLTKQIELHRPLDSAGIPHGSTIFHRGVSGPSTVAFFPFNFNDKTKAKMAGTGAESIWDVITQEPQIFPGFCEREVLDIPSISVVQYMHSEILDPPSLLAHKNDFLTKGLRKLLDLGDSNRHTNNKSLRCDHWAKIAVFCIEFGADPHANPVLTSEVRLALKSLPNPTSIVKKLIQLIDGGGKKTAVVPKLSKFLNSIACWKA